MRQPFCVAATPTVVRISPPLRAAFAAAVLCTLTEFVLLLSRFAPSSRPVTQTREGSPLSERVTFIVPRAAGTSSRDAGRSPRANAGAISPPLFGVSPARADSLAHAPAARVPTSPDSVPPVSASSAPSPSPGGASIGTSVTRGPVLAPRGFNPSAPLTRRVIDSVLDSLNAKMPALLWARVPTQAERDAAGKESAMAMRLSGRTLLVPADPHLAQGFGLPSVFSRRKQREAARARSDSILAENMARLARLRERARRDSLRRDSVQRADAMRRADSVGALTPRRPPDARTPA